MHLNPHAKCRSSRFNLKLFKKEKRGSLKLWKHIKRDDNSAATSIGGKLHIFYSVSSGLQKQNTANTQKEAHYSIFKTDYRLMQVKNAESSKESILQFFRPSLCFVLSIFEWSLKTGLTV